MHYKIWTINLRSCFHKLTIRVPKYNRRVFISKSCTFIKIFLKIFSAQKNNPFTGCFLCNNRYILISFFGIFALVSSPVYSHLIPNSFILAARRAYPSLHGWQKSSKNHPALTTPCSHSLPGLIILSFI